MDILEAVIILVVVVGSIFASLIVLHVIGEVYKCTLVCLRDKVLNLLRAIWKNW